jgi:gluconate:H+ symporter, GntP family
VIYLVSRRSQLSLITVGIPALAGLSAMHGFVPPHPGPVTAIGLLNADLGITLALGVAVAIPTIIVAGPLFGKLAGKWVVVEAPHTFDPDTFADEGGNGGTQVRTEGGSTQVREEGGGTQVREEGGSTQVREEGGSTQVRTERRRPSFGITLFTVLLPVALMLGKALVDIFIDDKTQWFRQIFDTVGTPLLALLIAVIVGMITLGRGAGMTRKHLTMAIESGLPPVAGIILIVAAGGGFKQVLVDSGIGTLLARWAEGAHFPVIVLAWILAVLIRLATGSATVATITASSLIIGLVEGMSTGQVSLAVLAVGAGSLFFSHVNDAGFWLVNQYFRLTVSQTIKTWSLMETVLSVTGLGMVLLLDLVI